MVSRHARRLRELLEEQGISVSILGELSDSRDLRHLTLVSGSLRQGWSLRTSDTRTVIYTDNEIFGMVKERRPRRSRAVPQAPFTSEMTPGTYVVHVDHGVARFAGTTGMGGENGHRQRLTR